jgi:hypothetical protein
MRKYLNIALIGLTTVLFAACSSDEPKNDPGNGQTFKGEKAYIKVSVTTPNSTTSSSTRSGDFESGSLNEQQITSARFFFYDIDGNFVSEGNIWKDGERQDDNSSIEYNGRTVLELDNVETTPAYVVTILNAPEMTPPATLDDMKSALTEVEMVSGGRLKDGSFVMTTSSYDQNQNPYYFVTNIDSSNVHGNVDDTAADPEPLRIYVERVGSKIRLNLIGTTSQNTYSLGKLKVTGEKEKEMYVKVEGWGLNGINNKSYLMKHIDNTWSTDKLGFEWNDESSKRSYWGMSYNYGDESFAYSDEYEVGAKNGLDYITANAITGSMNDANYCFENTNTGELLQKHYPSAMTSVLLRARIVDADGNSESLVKLNDTFYTHPEFLDYVFTQLRSQGKLQYLHNGREISVIDLQVGNAKYLNGRVVVEVNDKSGWTTTRGREVEATVINEELASFSELEDAIGYRDGLMYYNVPIEHMNPTEDTTNAQGQVTSIAEGHYGVVRNHIYSVTVSEINHVGQGIQDPDEPIIPPKGDNLYKLKAQINILKWNVVIQRQEL